MNMPAAIESAIPRKLILRNHLSPGDILMLTAAVRDLHRCHPGRFLTDVRTSCPDLWKHNPHLTKIEYTDPEAMVVECHYPLIHRSNTTPLHFIWGFMEHLNTQLGLTIRPTEFRGDIHLSEAERRQPSFVERTAGERLPYWLVAAGGKYDFTIKWWSQSRFQAVIDHFRDRLLFVQVGEYGHHHPPLSGVLDLRGKTAARDLIQLVHHADGVLCPVTLLMHLSAAVPTHDLRTRSRPCVVIAGGREPVQWEAYPTHQFIHTIGALWCCREGGCWKSRTSPLADGTENDHPSRLCVDVVAELPRCMDLITPEEVVRRIELYLNGGMARQLDAGDRAGVRRLFRRQDVRARNATTARSQPVRGTVAARDRISRGPVSVSSQPSHPSVLHLLPTSRLGGIARSVLTLCQATAATCAGVVVYEEGPAIRLLQSRGIPVFRFARAKDSPRHQRELARLVRRANLVHAHCCADYELGHQFSRLFPKPSVVTLHWNRKFPLLAAPLICPSQALAQAQTPENDCRVIPRGIDPQEFPFVDRSRRTSHPLRLIKICRPEKCAAYFDELIKRLFASHPGLQLLVVGETGEDSPDIRWTGERRDVRPWLRQADILLHTPKPTGGTHDLAVLEAMSMGVIPVAANTLGTRESIRDGIDGFLLEPDDINGFVDRVQFLINHPDQRREISRNAAARIRQDFTRERMISQYQEVYKEVLSR